MPGRPARPILSAGMRTTVTREHKLALIVGFSLVLVLGVLISDHFSKARTGAPLAVEIKEPASSLFGPQSARAGQQGPSNTLPETHVAAPPPRPLDDLPGFKQQAGPSGMPLPAGTDVVVSRSGREFADLNSSGLPLVNTRETPTPLPTPTPSTQQSALPVSTGALKRYDVKAEENMLSIARRFYGESGIWTKLRDYNKGKVSENGGIREGITLDIPPRDVLDGKARLADVRQTAPAGQPFPGTSLTADGHILLPKPDLKLDQKPDPRADPKADPKAAAYATYTVQEGDTMYSIARKKLGSTKRVQDLVDANKAVLSSPDELHVGMSIRIPTR